MNTLVRSRRETIELGDLKLIRHFGTEIERVRVVIRILVAHKTHVEVALRDDDMLVVGMLRICGNNFMRTIVMRSDMSFSPSVA